MINICKECFSYKMSYLLALVGHPRSGKSTLAARLESDFGFTCVSGSSLLRASAEQLPGAKRPTLATRQDFDAYHRQWREQYGRDAMGRHVVKLYQEGRSSVCFENVRNKYDAHTIRAAGGLLIGLECPLEARFSRARNAQVARDSLDISNFRAAETPEYNSPDALGSHVSAVLAEADVVLDSSLERDEVVAALLRQVPLD